MKKTTRTNSRNTVYSEIHFDDGPENPTDLTYRWKVREAFESGANAQALLHEITSGYLNYKKSRYELFGLSLDPHVFSKKKKPPYKDIHEFIPEPYLDFLIQALMDFLSGEEAEDAFGTRKKAGRKTTTDSKAVAAFFDSCKNEGGYEYAVLETANKFGLSAKRIKIIYNESDKDYKIHKVRTTPRK